jgi:hypothetical protein
MYRDIPIGRCWYPGPGPTYLTGRALMHEGSGHELYTKLYRTAEGEVQRARLGCRCGGGHLGILVEVTDPTEGEIPKTDQLRLPAGRLSVDRQEVVSKGRHMSEESTVVRIWRDSIYGWFAKNGRTGRSGRWHAHSGLGRDLCPRGYRQVTSTYGWLHRENRPPKEEACPDCWKLPDQGILVSREPRPARTESGA